MFEDDTPSFIDAEAPPLGYSPLHGMPAVERQIVRRLAEVVGRGADELAQELTSADPDLPVEERDLASILGALEDDFEVSLCPPGAAQMGYVRELALLIRRRTSSAPPEGATRTSVRQPSARRRTRRRAHAPRARRNASAG